MRFKSTLIFFIIYFFLEGCSPPSWVKPLTEGSKKQQEKKAISVAIFDAEGTAISDIEKEQICTYFYTKLLKMKNVNMIDRNRLNIELLKNDFPLEITDINTAIAAGKFLAADKVITSYCGKIDVTWMISVKLIDVKTGAVDIAISNEGLKNEILDETISSIVKILQENKCAKAMGKRGFLIVLGTATVGELITLLLDKKAKRMPDTELPKPNNFPNQ